MTPQRLIYNEMKAEVKREVKTVPKTSISEGRLSERKKVWGSRLILTLIGASLTVPFQFVSVHTYKLWPFGHVSSVLEVIGIILFYILGGVVVTAIVGCALVTLVWLLHVLIMTSLRKKHITWKEWW